MILLLHTPWSVGAGFEGYCARSARTAWLAKLRSMRWPKVTAPCSDSRRFRESTADSRGLAMKVCSKLAKVSRLSTLSLPHLNLSLLVPVRAPSQRILNHKTPRPPLNQRSTANKFTLVSFISQLRFISIFNTRSFGIQQHSISEYVGPSQARLISHSSREGRERCSIERKGQSGGGLKIRQRELLRRGRGEFEYVWTPKRA